MLLLLAMISVMEPAAAPQKNDDPIICKRDRDGEVGTHMRPKPVCMKKSDWDIVEKQTRTELQSLHERSSFDPGKADGQGPH